MYHRPPSAPGYGYPAQQWNQPPPEQQHGRGYYPPRHPQQPYQQTYRSAPPPPQQYGGYPRDPPLPPRPSSNSPQPYPYPPGQMNRYPPPQQQYSPPQQQPPYTPPYSHSPPPHQIQQQLQRQQGPPPTSSPHHGMRKALLIGINYFGHTKGQLQGCINDVHRLSKFLTEDHGYRWEDMVILTDDQQNPKAQPTKVNILRAMRWLVSGARRGDSMFLLFSGHGGRTPDLDGDEDDGYDETIYPVDYQVAGHIVDDEMHDIMVRPLPPGARLTAIFDSCHSGTVLDLPYVYSTQGVLKEPNLAKEAAQDLFSAFNSYEKGDVRAIADTAIGFFKKATVSDDARERSKAAKTAVGDVIMFSGSKDTETSADAFIGGKATGALSWAFVEALRKQPRQTYLELLNTIRSELEEKKYRQKPQLSCCRPLDVDLPFVM